MKIEQVKSVGRGYEKDCLFNELDHVIAQNERITIIDNHKLGKAKKH